MNNLQIGDRCTFNKEGGLVVNGVITEISSNSAYIFISTSGKTIEVQLNKIERHPRPLEIIEVWESDAWVLRQAVCVEDSGVWVIDAEEGLKFYMDWHLLSDKETKEEIIRRIEEDDKDILGELAEIILAAREKVAL